MAAWTEEATFPHRAADRAALRQAAPEAFAITGVPWVTIGLLLAAACVLFAAAGLRSSVGLHSLLLYGAKATPLILDRGETWRLFAANLLHKDPLHLAFNAFALWNVRGALERAVRRLAAAAGALIGTLSLGVVAAPALPALGQFRQGPAAVEVKMPLGWRRATSSPSSVSYSNGLTGAFRSSATLIQEGSCRGHLCTCERLARSPGEGDLWRLAGIRPVKKVHLGEASARPRGA